MLETGLFFFFFSVAFAAIRGAIVSPSASSSLRLLPGASCGFSLVLTHKAAPHLSGCLCSCFPLVLIIFGSPLPTHSHILLNNPGVFPLHVHPVFPGTLPAGRGITACNVGMGAFCIYAAWSQTVPSPHGTGTATLAFVSKLPLPTSQQREWSSLSLVH